MIGMALQNLFFLSLRKKLLTGHGICSLGSTRCPRRGSTSPTLAETRIWTLTLMRKSDRYGWIWGRKWLWHLTLPLVYVCSVYTHTMYLFKVLVVSTMSCIIYISGRMEGSELEFFFYLCNYCGQYLRIINNISRPLLKLWYSYELPVQYNNLTS